MAGQGRARLIRLALSVALHSQLAVNQLAAGHYLESAGATGRRTSGDFDLPRELFANEAL